MPQVPSRNDIDISWFTLKALESSGGSATNAELSNSVSEAMNLPAEVLDIPHLDGPETQFNYILYWARTDLKAIGAVNNETRAVWTITESGRNIPSRQELEKLVANMREEKRRLRQANEPTTTTIDVLEDEDNESQSWEDELLAILKNIKPDEFERLCQRILRESGFTKVEVTGRSGDGGIDGAGILRVNLISFHVRFQCKRYAGSVGSPEIRAFRGAMDGGTDKGLFITTGRFTKDAEQEAIRAGAQAIDLIDGVDLIALLKSLNLGVSTELVESVVESVTVIPEFFNTL